MATPAKKAPAKKAPAKSQANTTTKDQETPTPPATFEGALMDRAVAELTPFEKKLEVYRKGFGSTVYDLDDEKQLKQCKSDRLTLAKAITALDATHAELKGPLKVLSDKLDAKRKSIKDPLDEMRKSRLNLVTEHENKAKAVEAEQESRLSRIRDLIIFHGVPTSTDIKAKQDLMEAMLQNLDEAHYGNHLDSAKLGIHTARAQLDTMLVSALASEEAAEENARLRKELEDAKEATRKRDLEDAKNGTLNDGFGGPSNDRGFAGTETGETVVHFDESNPPPEEGLQQHEFYPAPSTSEDDAVERRREINKTAVNDVMLATGITNGQAMEVVKAIVQGMITNVSITYD